MKKKSGLLADLFPRQEQRLFHVLVCPACRERATLELLEEHGMALVLPRAPREALEGVPCAAMARPWTPAQELLTELLSHPREHHYELLEEPRFQVVELVELLLARSREEQLEDPELSEYLAQSAGRLATLTPEVEAGEGLESTLTRAGILMVNACRLAGRLADADKLLGNTVFYAAPVGDRARFYQTMGLLRWEQGQLNEGTSHLLQAVRLSSQEDRLADEGTALTLLGLLYAEDGLLELCAGALLAGLPLLASERRPWLTARGCLTLARALAGSGQTEEASHLVSCGRKLIPAVTDSAEAARLYALTGTVSGWLGREDEACHLLDPARRRFLNEGRLCEAASATLDLALALAELDRPAEIGPLADQIERRFPALAPAAEVAAVIRGTPWSDLGGLRRQVESTAVTLRRLLRRHGIRRRPLPFA